MASFLAAGTAYANYGLPMIPFYIFYSIFGFQRVGDMIWACGDMMCKGFLLGGTSGRTTLNGEGVQHQDGHSQLIASTVPNLKSFDPAFAFEIALIVRDGIRAMYQERQDLFYYITLTNQAYPMPPMPEGVEGGVLQGMYCFDRTEGATVNLFGSGAVMAEVLRARELLDADGVRSNVWSVTSYNELARQARQVERQQMLSLGDIEEKPYVQALLEGENGVFIAASDYMKALPGMIAPWIPGAYTVLGTDGFGLSEARDRLRDYFEVSGEWIAFAALSTLAQNNLAPWAGGLGLRRPARAEARPNRRSLGLKPPKPAPPRQPARRVHIVGCRRSGTTLMMELLWYSYAFSGRGEHETSLFEPVPPGETLYLDEKNRRTPRASSPPSCGNDDTYLIAMLRDPRAVVTSRHRSRPDVLLRQLPALAQPTPAAINAPSGPPALLGHPLRVPDHRTGRGASRHRSLAALPHPPTRPPWRHQPHLY